MPVLVCVCVCEFMVQTKTVVEHTKIQSHKIQYQSSSTQSKLRLGKIWLLFFNVVNSSIAHMLTNLLTTGV